MSISATNTNNSYRHVWEFQKGAAYSRIYNYQCNIVNIYVNACINNVLSLNISDLKEAYEDIDNPCYRKLNDGTTLIATREDRYEVKQLVFRFLEEGPLTMSTNGTKFLNLERFTRITDSRWEHVWRAYSANFFLHQMGAQVLKELPVPKCTGVPPSCYEYALCQIGDKGNVLNILGEGAIMEIGFFLKWGYKIVEKPQKNDLVIYSAKGIVKHAGRYLGSNEVESKMGAYSRIVLKHSLYCVPAPYGNELTFLRKSVK